jgi:hypothetical protein
MRFPYLHAKEHRRLTDYIDDNGMEVRGFGVQFPANKRKSKVVPVTGRGGL